jgi:uncharacterized membrane protein YgcG
MRIHYLVILMVIGLIPTITFAEVVRNFDSIITINTDRSIQVEENINYDFEENERRGIYRVIPTRGINISGDIRSLQNGTEAVQDINRGLNDVTIRLGDEDIYITGLNQYQIQYPVKGVIKKLQDRDELNWQVTGTEWEVPIERASAQIRLPQDLRDQVGDKIFCYTGISTSAEQNCTIAWRDNRTVDIVANTELALGEGLTVAIGFPLGTLTPATWWEQNELIIYRSIAGGILVLGSLILYLVWNKWAKDPRIRKPIVRQYEAPKGLSPAGVIRLKTTYATPVEISATIISLAQQGVLSITQLEEKKWFNNASYQFDLKDIPLHKTLKPFEQKLVNIIFKEGRTHVTTKQLEDEQISSKFSEVYTSIYQDEVRQYYINSPIVLRSVLGGVAGILLIGGFILSLGLSPWIGVACIILGIEALIIAYYAPKRTEEGTRVLEHILGLEEYIKVAEKDRLQFQEKEYIFFEILPYAIALGLATIWAKAFEGLITTNPEWYHSNNGVIFIPTDFVSSIDSSFSSGISSSGGGSVGGGSGGGGGGSW